MEKTDVKQVDERILELSEKLQKLLSRSSEPLVLLGIKRELEFWRQQKQSMSTPTSTVLRRVAF